MGELKVENNADIHRFAVLFLVFSIQPRIADRTQIQKLAYIVNECGWHALDDFKFLARGPYSQWLDSQLDIWRDEGIVDEAEESILVGTDNEVGFWCYSLTAKGESLAKSVFDSINKPKLVDDTLRHLGRLSKYTEKELEIAASILYVRGEELDSDGVVKRILSFRPEFREEEVRKHLGVLEYARDSAAS